MVCVCVEFSRKRSHFLEYLLVGALCKFAFVYIIFHMVLFIVHPLQFSTILCCVCSSERAKSVNLYMYVDVEYMKICYEYKDLQQQKSIIVLQ